MAAPGNPQQAVAQMYQELEVARNQLNAMAEQNRRAAEEIARLRNPFGPQNGPRPFVQNPVPGSFDQHGPRPFVQNPGSSAQNQHPGPFMQNQQPGPFNPNPQFGTVPPQHIRPPPMNNGSQPFQQSFQNGSQPFPGGSQPFQQGSQPFQHGPPPFQNGSQNFQYGTQPHPVPLNGDANGSSHDNGLNSGVNPQTGATLDHNDPVAQRLKMLEDQNERVLSLLAKLPGAAVPVDVEPRSGFQASPFIDKIATVEVPKKYNIPVFTPKYSGVTDPTEHVAQYKQLMWTISIPFMYQEVCMCKSFGATLTGPALQWLINLKPKSIGSFAELVNQFSQQFASSRKMEKQTSDLYYVVQKANESIRSYFNRFNAEMISIRNCDIKTAIEAYKRGLDDSSGLYTDLTKYPPENFEDVRARTLAYMRVEDDAAFRRKHTDNMKSLGVRKPEFKAKAVSRIEPARQISNVRFKTKAEAKTASKFTQYPKISSYGFKGSARDLVEALKNSQATIRWPKKSDLDDAKKDKSKWCDFHVDHGHATDDCIALKKELAYHVPKGNLKDIISDAVAPASSHRPSTPEHAKVVNCITGGSDVCGLTYSAAKRHASQAPDDRPIPRSSRPKGDLELEAMKIVFDNVDLGDSYQKHHDGLIIQLTVGNCLTRRVLIDGGSSANVIFLSTIKAMGIDRSEITRRSTTLVGFSGEATSTFGEIILPVYAGGINKQTKFSVIDCASAYNIILGRPWIHDMKAVPSTYHQMLKFPTPWGIQEIKSEPKIARECYKFTLKPRK